MALHTDGGIIAKVNPHYKEYDSTPGTKLSTPHARLRQQGEEADDANGIALDAGKLYHDPELP